MSTNAETFEDHCRICSVCASGGVCESRVARCAGLAGCTAPLAHAEHHYHRVRYWCEQHTPWSGHHGHCDDHCKKLIAAIDPKNARMAEEAAFALDDAITRGGCIKRGYGVSPPLTKPEVERARRAMAAPKFRWMPGMAGIRLTVAGGLESIRVVDVDARQTRLITSPNGSWVAAADCILDLFDAATLGCLLDLSGFPFDTELIVADFE